MGIIYPELNGKKNQPPHTPQIHEGEACYWVRDMRHAGTTDEACNTVIPNCSFVASPQFFLGVIPQTIRIYLLLHIRGWWHSYATKIPMSPCPGYYSSYTELKMKTKQKR